MLTGQLARRERLRILRRLVRELEQSLERAFDDRQKRDLRGELLLHLRRARGNVAEVARRMGRARTLVHRWLKQFEIDPNKFRRGPGGRHELRSRLVLHLRRAGGKVTEVARRMGRARPLVYRWLNRFEIDPNKFRPELERRHERVLSERQKRDLRAQLLMHLRSTDGNVVEVARRMGRARQLLYRWLNRFGIDPDDFRS